MDNENQLLLKKKDEKTTQQKENNVSPVKSFTPPPSGVDPIPVQKMSNPIQLMQDLPADERPDYFKPNYIQQLQALPENERPEILKPNLIQTIQRKKAEEKEEEESDTSTINLTSEQIDKAKTTNDFIITEANSKKIIQSFFNLSESGQFDEVTVNSIANYQNNNSTLNRQDGILDYNTLDLLIKDLIIENKHQQVLNLVSDFYNIGEHEIEYIFQFDASLNEKYKV